MTGGARIEDGGWGLCDLTTLRGFCGRGEGQDWGTRCGWMSHSESRFLCRGLSKRIGNWWFGAICGDDTGRSHTTRVVESVYFNGRKDGSGPPKNCSSGNFRLWLGVSKWSCHRRYAIHQFSLTKVLTNLLEERRLVTKRLLLMSYVYTHAHTQTQTDLVTVRGRQTPNVWWVAWVQLLSEFCKTGFLST